MHIKFCILYRFHGAEDAFMWRTAHFQQARDIYSHSKTSLTGLQKHVHKSIENTSSLTGCHALECWCGELHTEVLRWREPKRRVCVSMFLKQRCLVHLHPQWLSAISVFNQQVRGQRSSTDPHPHTLLRFRMLIFTRVINETHVC